MTGELPSPPLAQTPCARVLSSDTVCSPTYWREDTVCTPTPAKLAHISTLFHSLGTAHISTLHWELHTADWEESVR